MIVWGVLMKRNFETKFYEFFGIRQFKLLVSKIGFLNGDISDLKKTKKKAFLNSLFCTALFVGCFPLLLEAYEISVPLTVFCSLFFVADLYCIMLQRYNIIGVNHVIGRVENRKKDYIKDELRKKDSLLMNHSYKIVDKDKEVSVSLEDLILDASLDELRQYHKYLVSFQNFNQQLDKNKIFSSENEVNISASLGKGRSLKLNLKKNK